MANLSNAAKITLKAQVSKSICVVTPSRKIALVPEEMFNSFLMDMANDKQLARDTIRKVASYQSNDLADGNRIIVQLLQGAAAVSQKSPAQILKLMGV